MASLSAADVGQLIAAGAAIIALGYTGEQLRQNRRLASQQLTYNYMERLNDPAFIEIVAEARAFWLVP